MPAWVLALHCIQLDNHDDNRYRYVDNNHNDGFVNYGHHHDHNDDHNDHKYSDANHDHYVAPVRLERIRRVVCSNFLGQNVKAVCSP